MNGSITNMASTGKDSYFEELASMIIRSSKKSARIYMANDVASRALSLCFCLFVVLFSFLRASFSCRLRSMSEGPL